MKEINEEERDEEYKYHEKMTYKKEDLMRCEAMFMIHELSCILKQNNNHLQPYFLIFISA